MLKCIHLQRMKILNPGKRERRIRLCMPTYAKCVILCQDVEEVFPEREQSLLSRI